MQQASKPLLLTVLLLFFVLAAKTASARLAADDTVLPSELGFHRQLKAALAYLDRSNDPYLRQLHAAILAAPGVITFRQMTNDPVTWSNKGDPNHGHTQPADGRRKNEDRTRPTEATVFIPISAIQPGHSQWKNGVFVHELVHALDLATGHWSRDYTVRERRATFMQNVWRHHVGSRLRVSYHDRFATLDYQYAARHGTAEDYANYIFTRADFPKAPAN